VLFSQKDIILRHRSRSVDYTDFQCNIYSELEAEIVAYIEETAPEKEVPRMLGLLPIKEKQSQ
jgi:hypothetical protein